MKTFKVLQHLKKQSAYELGVHREAAEEYFEKCELLRKYFKNPALTTDVIVGFPGETEEEFYEQFYEKYPVIIIL